MPDCFISYSSTDQQFASYVRDELQRRNLDVFMASASLVPGSQWAPEILTALRNSSWVILLASRAACQSAFVNQEIGGALVSSKKLVPIIWDMEPSELPGWASRFQALNLRGLDAYQARAQIGKIATRIKQQKTQGLMIGAALFAAFLYLANDN